MAAPTLPTPRILVVDDDPAWAKLITRVVAKEGYGVDAVGDGAAAFTAALNHSPDVIVLDVMLPGMNGVDVCRRLKQESRTRLTPVVMVTGNDERELRIAGLEAGADDFLIKPLDVDELLARLRSLSRMKRYTDDMDSAASILVSLAVLIEGRDGTGEGHCHRMANYATRLGRRIGLDAADLQTLHRGGFLHDIGMLTVPESVLRKAGPLEPDEYELVKSHTIVGESLCRTRGSLSAVQSIIRSHHERLDGSGYPDALMGEEIPVVAQIIGIVDVFDAITTERAYQRTQAVDEALATLRAHVRKGWRQHDLVEAFVEMVSSGQLDSVN